MSFGQNVSEYIKDLPHEGEPIYLTNVFTDKYFCGKKKNPKIELKTKTNSSWKVLLKIWTI